jgi:hypothetical protein
VVFDLLRPHLYHQRRESAIRPEAFRRPPAAHARPGPAAATWYLATVSTAGSGIDRLDQQQP